MRKSYYFIGIKGAGMSSMAQILSDLDFEVRGSDIANHFFTQDNLEARSITIDQFEDDIDFSQYDEIIAGNAFPNTHPQITKAINQGAKVTRYPDFLATFADQFNNVAITGTHGKTTTTGMLAKVLQDHTKSGYLIGDGHGMMEKDAEFFAFEACEYRNHFLSYKPNYAIVTNVEYDHPDFFHDLDHVKSTFQQLSQKVKKAMIVCNDDQNAASIKYEAQVYTYGIRVKSDVFASNIRTTNKGYTFNLNLFDQYYENVTLPFFGDHMLQNSLAVICVATLLEIPFTDILDSLSNFTGVARRFSEQVVGSNIVIDDYAHHPTEIKVTVEAIKQKYPDKKINIIFQPHTFSRTIALFDEFAKELSKADRVFLLDIFGSAREKNGDMKIDDLIASITNAQLLSKALDELKLIENEVIVFMGAGNVNELIPQYMKIFSKK